MRKQPSSHAKVSCDLPTNDERCSFRFDAELLSRVVDDILVFCPTFRQHLEDLLRVVNSVDGLYWVGT